VVEQAQRLEPPGGGWKDQVLQGYALVLLHVVTEPARRQPRPAQRYPCSAPDTPAWVRVQARHDARTQ
jgi:hypothetical protein